MPAVGQSWPCRRQSQVLPGNSLAPHRLPCPCCATSSPALPRHGWASSPSKSMELGLFPSLSGHGNLHKMSFFFPLGEVFILFYFFGMIHLNIIIQRWVILLTNKIHVYSRGTFAFVVIRLSKNTYSSEWPLVNLKWVTIKIKILLRRLLVNFLKWFLN